MATPPGVQFNEEYKINGLIHNTTYKGINTITSAEVAIKVKTDENHSSFIHEAEVLMSLSGCVGMPNVHSYHEPFLVLDLLGPDLESLFEFCDYKLSFETIRRLAVQLISRIQCIHDQSFIHGNIKTNKFVMGLGTLGNEIFVVGFGLARRYRESKTLKTLTNDQSRSDDMVSLGNVLLQLCKGLRSVDVPSKDWRNTPIEVICKGLPADFIIFMNYVRQLGVNSKPDYNYLCEIFRGGFSKSHVFEWTIKKYHPDRVDLVAAATAAVQISRKDFIAKVKNVYSELTSVERKCVEIRITQEHDETQLNTCAGTFKTLLNMYHNFFMGIEGSTVDADLQLAEKHEMPKRVWLWVYYIMDLLWERQVPRGYMIDFFHAAYFVMASLLKIAPRFKENWIQCLGEISRFRMGISKTQRESDAWSQRAIQWYLAGAVSSPTTGLWYHRLAMLSNADALHQLLYLGKSLTVNIPSATWQESRDSFFAQVLNSPITDGVYDSFCRCHAIVLKGNSATFDTALDKFTSALIVDIECTKEEYLERGYCVAICNCNLFIMLELQGSQTHDREIDTDKSERLIMASRLFNETARVFLQRGRDTNVHSFLHVTLVFMLRMSKIPEAMRIIEVDFPWQLLVITLNAILSDKHTSCAIEGDSILKPELVWQSSPEAQQHEDFPLFPEDWAMLGLPWTINYPAAGCFLDGNIDAEMRYVEDISVSTIHRPNRILWLGCHPMHSSRHFKYDAGAFHMLDATVEGRNVEDETGLRIGEMSMT